MTNISKADQMDSSQNQTSAGEKIDFPTAITCNLAGANNFAFSCFSPNVSVLAAFGAEQLHAHQLFGRWDLSKASAENSGALVRSVRRTARDDGTIRWDALTFQFGRRQILCMDDAEIVGFASNPETAERLAAKFGKAYALPPKPAGGAFYLISQTGNVIECHQVDLPAVTTLNPETFRLHYGEESAAWHKNFAEKLCGKKHGLAIFEGRPGTGKTFYLRHLMGTLKASHRFYFIPTAYLSVLSQPEFISFWAEQRQTHDARQFVVVLEDSEDALMTRGSDNRGKVSAILNLTDGMLADFLRLQIICTINCSAADIDPALLRPGRLIGHRVFERLNPAQAARLAESLGRKLPTTSDYSLAEIFADNERPETQRQPIGFNA